MSNSKHDEFKLLAIRPLKGCASQYIKILKEDTLYKFYNDYAFYNKDGKEVQDDEPVIEIKNEGVKSIRLYAQGDVSVNISAIVGKNGSGKSTLIELFFLSIYVISLKKRYINEVSKYKNAVSQLMQEKKKELDNIDNKAKIYTNPIIRRTVDLNHQLIQLKEHCESDDAKSLIREFLDNNNIEVENIRKNYKVENKNEINNRYLKNQKKLEQEFKETEEFNKSILEGLKLELYYQKDDDYFCVLINNSSISHTVMSSDKQMIRKYRLYNILNEDAESDIFNIKDFFYSIAINYSIHGLNSRNVGNWVTSLFHKNDGYKTPLVLNPMRTNGNFDINDENDFAKSRLLSNTLASKKEDFLITDNQSISRVEFRLNASKIENAIIKYSKFNPNQYIDFKEVFENNLKYSGDGEVQLIAKFFNVFVNEKYIRSDYFSDVKYHAEVKRYIIKKLIKIARTYDEYKPYFKDSFDIKKKDKEEKKILKFSEFEDENNYLFVFKDFEQYIKLLYKDHSHITFKLRQAVNYLVNNPFKGNDNYSWQPSKKGDLRESFNVKIEDLKTIIKTESGKVSDLIYSLPPSLFDIEIILTDNKKESKFTDLSSGEQQLIHSLQSIIYHIININSINQSSRVNYSRINIILDEVELYFHPDMQRKFINQLLNAIKNADLNTRMCINILFSTHSPFILSDIPSSNILMLDKGKSENYYLKGQSFGANVHDLLDNSFFMENGFMGEFAKNKIDKVIRFLDLSKCYKEYLQVTEKGNKEEQKSIKNKVNRYFSYDIEFKKEPLVDFLNSNAFSQVYYKKIIDLIGEPIIKESLLDLYYDIFYQTDDDIDNEIARLNKFKEDRTI